MTPTIGNMESKMYDPENKKKPFATQQEVNNKQDILLEGAFVDGDKTKLNGIEDGATAEKAFYDNGNSGASKTIDFTANGNNQIITISEATSLTLSNLINGKTNYLKVINGGAFTITWVTAIAWAGGVAPTLTASGVDFITLKSDGTTIYADFGYDFATV